jgi:hypothetical protein
MKGRCMICFSLSHYSLLRTLRLLKQTNACTKVEKLMRWKLLYRHLGVTRLGNARAYQTNALQLEWVFGHF